MTAPLHTIAALLRSADSTPGVVLSVSTAASARIATPSGAQLASPAPGSTLRPGQRVLLRHGLAYPAPAPGPVYPM